jgi:hypothetical protein
MFLRKEDSTGPKMITSDFGRYGRFSRFNIGVTDNRQIITVWFQGKQ